MAGWIGRLAAIANGLYGFTVREVVRARHSTRDLPELQAFHQVRSVPSRQAPQGMPRPYESLQEQGLVLVYESGCLSSLHPQYDSLPDWHQGFLAGYRTEAGVVTLSPVVIQGARMIWGAKAFAGS